MIRIALIDDHESVRLGLAAACERAGDIDVVASVPTVTHYLSERHCPAPDVAVLDLTLGDGATVTENVHRLIDSGSPVVIHSVADRPDSVREALAAGAAGSSRSPRARMTSSPPSGPWRRAKRSTISVGSCRGGRPRVQRCAALSARARGVAALRRRPAAQSGRRPARNRVLTAKENITRIRTKYVDVGRPAPTKIDLLRRAMEDGLVTEDHGER